MKVRMICNVFLNEIFLTAGAIIEIPDAVYKQIEDSCVKVTEGEAVKFPQVKRKNIEAPANRAMPTRLVSRKGKR